MNWLILIFPFACGFIGLFTNWLALRMLFQPAEEKTYFGFIKWQAIVAKNFPRFAKIMANVVENELINMEDIARYIDIKAELEKNKDAIYQAIERIYKENQSKIPSHYQKLINENSIKLFQDTIFQHMLEEAPKAFNLLMNFSQEKVGIRNFILQEILRQDVNAFEKIIYEVAGRELKFIVIYGGIFGGILGFAQYALYANNLSGILMPVFGASIGMLTNYLALLMLWSPQEPIKIWKVTLQGAVPSRSGEILSNLQTIISRDFLVIGEITTLKIEEINSEIIQQNIDYHLNKALPKNFPELAPILDVLNNPESQETIKAYITSTALERIPLIKEQAKFYAEEKIDVEKIMKAKNQATANEFTDFIKEILTSEPTMIILYGGLFGGIIGGLQWLFV